MTNICAIGRAVSAALLVSAVLAGCASDGDGGGLCDRASVQAALDGAGPGDTVRIGACRVSGSLRVPAGVTLEGEGAGTSVVAGTERAAVWLEPGEPGATVRHLGIESSGVAGIAGGGDATCAARAPGSIAIEDVTIDASAGWGIYVRCVEAAAVSRVRVNGPIRAETFESTIFTRVVGQEEAAGASCDTAPAGDCTAGETREMTPADCPSCGAITQVCTACERWSTITAREGVALWDVGDAQLVDVVVTGFAQIGLTSVRSSLSWTGGESREHLGVGLYSSASIIELADVTVRDSRRSPFRLDLVLGAYFGDGSDVTTTGLRVENSAGFGILDADSTAAHRDLVVHGNGDTGVWVGNSSAFSLDGGDFLENRFAGLVLRSAANVAIRDTTIADTAVLDSNRASGVETGRVTAGDGLHVRETVGLTVERVLLDGNDRTGILLDLGIDGAAPSVAFTDVTARATGAELGAIAGYTTGTQLTPAPSGGWDVGITREGAALANDAAWMTALDIAGVVIPSDLPRPQQLAGVVLPSV